MSDYLITEDGDHLTTQLSDRLIIEASDAGLPIAPGGTMKIIEPIEIMDSMVSSGFTNEVLEGDYAEFDLVTTYATGDRVMVTEQYGLFGEPLDETPRYWYGITGTIQGNMYACCYLDSLPSNPGYIYMKEKEEEPGSKYYIPTTFKKVASSPAKFWWGMCTHSNDDVYATCYSSGGTAGDIYKQTGGSGLFVSLAQADRQWSGICSNGTHVFAAVYGGDLYKQTNGTGDFAALSIGNKNWSRMCCAPNGDIYAAVYGGDIWVSTDDGVSFNVIADTDRNWNGLCATASGNIFASVYNGGIYKRSAGAGTFAATSNITRSWMAIGIDPVTHDIYAAVGVSGDIYISRYRGGSEIHKVYESLIDSNTGNFPPSDVLAAIPKWLTISSTNKWKVFDGKTTDQMIKVSPAVYVITPGVAFNSMALLNLDATSVTIDVDDPAYSEVVDTGATDIVVLNLSGDADSILTITMTNSVGSVKCGEIILGNYTSLGTFRPIPTVGIVSYSTKTQDVFGNYTILSRSFSKRMSCQIQIQNTSLDSIYNLLVGYRDIPLVWIGSNLYSCTIIYGFYKDFSIVISSIKISDCNLEVEGLT